MPYISLIKKLTRHDRSPAEDLDLVANLKLTVAELADLKNVVAQNQNSDLFMIEAETENSDLPAGVQYFIEPKSQLELSQLSKNTLEIGELLSNVEKLLSQSQQTDDKRIQDLLNMYSKQSELEESVVAIQEYDDLKILLPSQELVVQSMSDKLAKAAKLKEKIQQVEISNRDIDPIKENLLVAREKSLINASNQKREFIKVDEDDKSSSKSTSTQKLTKIFVVLIGLTLVAGALSLLISANFLFGLLSLFISFVLAFLYFFARSIPNLPNLSSAIAGTSERKSIQINSNQDADEQIAKYENEALQIALARKSYIESQDIMQQIQALLDGGTEQHLQSELAVLIEEIKTIKDRLNDLEHLSKQDILQLRRDLDILKIDTVRLQGDLSAVPELEQMMRIVTEIDSIRSMLKSYTDLENIVNKVTGFKYIRQSNGVIEGSTNYAEWAGLELTSKQQAQLSILNALETWLTQSSKSPVFITLPKGLFTLKQQDLIAKRVNKVKGLGTQLIFVELI